MGSRKQSEGIALLSMYNDDDEDDEMEEDIQEDQEQEAAQEPERQGDIYAMVEDDRIDINDSAVSVEQSTSVVASERLTPTLQLSRVNNIVSPLQLGVVALNLRMGSTRGSINIVDYGQDEVAMSPEPEDGGIEGSGRTKLGGEHENADGEPQNGMSSGTTQVLGHDRGSNQFSEVMQSDEMQHDAMVESDVGLLDETSKEEQNGVDPLDKFLPPPPKAKCSDELQRKINKFLEYKKAGKSFNAEVRNRKDYRNPDFLLHAVTYQEIDDLGSCFSKDVFNPHVYDPSDYYGQLEVNMRRESERKEQERKKAQKVDFISRVSQQETMASAPRINLPVSGFSNMVASGIPLVLPTTDAGNRDSRQNKKSKWDKVDGDQILPLPSTGQSSVSNVGSDAAMPTANAGGGYMLYVQQKRREAEEKRFSERRLERRS